MYLIVRQRNIHHEGDERSRSHPGQGYPAWTETVDKVVYCSNITALEDAIEGLKDSEYKVYQAKVEKSVKFNFIPN
jgi:hypothetical protein